MKKSLILGGLLSLTLVAMPWAWAKNAHPSPAKPAASAHPSAIPSPTPNPVTIEGDTIHITSDYMKYDRKAKMALADGNVIIDQGDTTIKTAQVQFDQNLKISYMNQPVHVIQHKPGDQATTLDSDRLTDYHKENRILAQGHVHFVRAKNPLAKPTDPSQKAKVVAAIKKDDTLITSDALEYWSVRKDANFTGNVVIINGAKKAWGDSALMSQAEGTITLDGHVKVVQINGNWLIQDGIVKDNPPDATRDAAIKGRSSITCDKLVMNQNTNDATATGQVVRVEQKGRVATSKQAIYSDQAKTITLSDTVRIQQGNGDWLTANKAIFHTDSEVFEAFGGGSTQIQTEFNVPNQPPAPQSSPGNRVQMEFNVHDTTK